MIRILLWILGIYFLSKFIFDFLVPLFKTTNHLKQQMRNMQDQMKANQANHNAQQQQQKEKAAKTAVDHEYIDFEEVK